MRNGARRPAAVAAAASLLLLGGACGNGGAGGGGSPSSGVPSEHGESSAKARTVAARSGAGLGKILSGGQDKTLYVFEKDKSPESTCSGACALAWPPMIVKAPPVAGEGGVRKSLLGTSKRADGKTQVTYKGRPLYFHQADQRAGQANGQGLEQFGARWFVLGTDGEAVTKKAKDGGGGH